MCINNNCGGCNTCQPNICNQCPPTECECAVRISTDCVTYTGDDLSCSSIPKDTILTDVIIQLDAYICQAIEDLNASINLVNIGNGSQIYKGVDNIGRRELRKINAVGDLITVTQNTNDISISLDEEALNNFIKLDNVGSGAESYKGFNAITDTHEFRSITIENLGTGKSFLRDIQQNTNELNIRGKTIVSDNLTVTETNEEIRIETPMTSSIPALYVNDLYFPTYNEWLTENSLQNSGTPLAGFIYRGKGTLSQPFTNNTVYPLLGGSPTITSNTAIQNSLDGDSLYLTPYSYVGTGTRLSPQRSGQQIIVQNNNTFYTFAGNFSYDNINIKLQTTVAATTSGYLIDMDNPLYFEPLNGRFSVTLEGEETLLECTDSLGIRNSGNTETAPPLYSSGRVGGMYGEGTLFFSYSGVDILNRYIFNGDGNNNDDNLHFQIKCRVRADQQGIYLTKNKMRIDFYNRLQSGVLLGTGNINLQAFRMTGGQVRFYEKGSIYFGNETSGRTYGVTFEPEDDGIGYTLFQLNSAQISGNSLNCFAKLNNEDVQFTAFNSPSGDGFSTTVPGTNLIVDGLFENLGAARWGINFKNNVFSFTGIDETKVDLTQGNNTSSINFIGNNVLENLVVHSSKANAKLAGLDANSAFIKRNVFNAVDLLAGIEYKVVTSGVPSLGTVGDFFTATGAETGTGTASLEIRETLS